MKKHIKTRIIALCSALMICHSVGFRIAAQNFPIIQSPPRYMRELSRLVAETASDDDFGEIRLTVGEPEMVVDGETRQITDDERIVPYIDENSDLQIPAEVIDDAGLNGSGFLSEEELEKQGYDVDYNMETDSLTVFDSYSSCRLIIKTSGGKPGEDGGALARVSMPGDRYVLQYADRYDAMRAAELFRTSEDILACVPDRRVHVDAISNPDASSVCWGSVYAQADSFMQNLPDAGSLPHIVVAVVDTGVDMEHPFLQGRIADGGWDFINDDDDPTDDQSHGTHCAGIIRDATPDNVKILPVKVFDENGGGYLALAMTGVSYAAEMGADVVSMSFGVIYGKNFVETEESIDIIYGDDVLATCRNHDTLLVAAAGNNMTNADGRFFPACLEEIIAVSSVDKFGGRSYFSNYGDYVDLAAPGDSILSSVPGGGYETMSGTSMSTPLVAACAALLRTEDDERTAEQTRRILQDRARDCGTPGKDMYYGYGIVSVSPVHTELTSVAFAAREFFINVHGSFELKVLYTPFYAKESALYFEVSDPSIAEIKYVNTVYAYGSGTTQITVRTADGRLCDTCTLHVLGSPVLRSIQGVYAGSGGDRSNGVIALRNDGTPEMMGFGKENYFGYYTCSSRYSWFNLWKDRYNFVSGIRDIWGTPLGTYFTNDQGELFAVGTQEIRSRDEPQQFSSEPWQIMMPDDNPLTRIIQVQNYWALRADGTVWHIRGAMAEQVVLKDETPLEGICSLHQYAAISESGEVYVLLHTKKNENGIRSSTKYASPVHAEGIDPQNIADCIIPYIVFDETESYPILWLLRDGTVWAQGSNYNMFGRPGTKTHSTPKQVIKFLRDPLTEVIQIEVLPQKNIAYALCADGTIWLWGDLTSDHGNEYWGTGIKPDVLSGYPKCMQTDESTILTGVKSLLPSQGERMLLLMEDNTVFWAGDTVITKNPNEDMFAPGAGFGFTPFAIPMEISDHQVVLQPDAEDVECQLVIPVKEFTVDTPSAFVRVGDTFSFQTSLTPEHANNRSVIWWSSDPKIASVSEDGTITANACGKVTISAIAASGRDVSVDCTLRVLPAASGRMIGDSDGDDRITLKDVTQIARYLAGGWNVVIDLINADMNGDGVINLKDVVLLRRCLVGA